MKMSGKWIFIELAVCLAVMMHLLLFMAVRPADRSGLAGVLVPPRTHYLARPSSPSPDQESDVRTVWSPVLFSLPSRMGFSRDMLDEKLHTRLTFKQLDDTERFLDVDRVSRSLDGTIVPRNLTMAFSENAVPKPPSMESPALENRAAPRRVHMTSGLKQRLVGGIVLPPDLNKQGNAAWEVRADMTVSTQGAIRHVFLEQPLEDAALNQAIIRLLHGLRFKPGDAPVEGYIEIYSPETLSNGGTKQ